MFEAVPWPAIGSFFAGLVSVLFLGYLWPYREERGATFFMGVIGSVTLWTVSYGVALLVFDPTLRFLFEIPIWLGTNFTAVFFLAFALEYTGRTQLVRSWMMAGLVAIQLLSTGLIATNPRHGLVWSEYRVEEVAGVAGVAVTNEPLLYIVLLVTMMMTAAGIVLLADAFASYGPLYRYQTLAIGLSPVPVIVGSLPWILQIGPVPQLNFAPLLFPLHLALDMYAFFRRNMFELTPAARRAGDQTAIDDLGIGVLIVDDDKHIININQKAGDILGQERTAILGSPLDSVWAEIDLTRESQRIRQPADRRQREYAVSVSTISDSGGTEVGHTVTLQDITAERQREQRLAVLNRVLRHNLRNDLNVASGYLDIVSEQSNDEQVKDMLSVASRNVDDVLALGEKARAVERTLDSKELGTEPVAVKPLLDEITATLTDEYGGTVDNRVPEELRIETNPQLLKSLFTNLIENALEHSTKNKPAVTIDVVVDRAVARFDIRDNGPGIPTHELDVISQGKETDLEHGSGIGLWLVTWASTALDGSVSFETGEDGTTVTVTLPNVVDQSANGEAKASEEQPPAATD
ncbi:PAS domain S-box-containing protein [Halohasta litchfieldiae]|uniref:histidine kinase n=1 Tax=Halohasta litchfieldiae TaxID=1073996 RepID=A0A1H6TQ12_9EURY|nr:histidine kinase N-terminal 7TM domain-containing protein [Halohasta litchfieldiae]ATW88926.1 PAS domain S-box-containing protein [Halohasta litchfieldiae]SEI81356.1 PAS domain S-box-containing protein [Halohasta litchfieldiae]